MSEENKVEEVLELFGGTIVKNTEPDEIDFEKPIKGTYVVEITKLNRYTGESEKCEGGVYDFWSLNMKVVSDVKGEVSGRRYLSKTYSNTVGKFQKDANEGKKKLMGDLLTADLGTVVKKVQTLITAGKDGDDAVGEISDDIFGAKMAVRCYLSSKKKQVVRVIEMKDEYLKEEDWSEEENEF